MLKLSKLRRFSLLILILSLLFLSHGNLVLANSKIKIPVPPVPSVAPTSPPKPSLNKQSCVIPTDGMVISESTSFCPGKYILPKGIVISGANITLDCRNAVLVGDKQNSGIKMEARDSTVKNCRFESYQTGIDDRSGEVRNQYLGNRFNDISYVAIFLEKNKGSLVKNNKITNSHIGISVYYTSDSVITNNIIDAVGIYGISLYYSFNNQIVRNIVRNSGWNSQGDWRSAIALHYVNEGNEITSNMLINNDLFNIYIRGRLPSEVPMNNKIWKNHLIGTGVTTYSDDKNIWCVNGVGNHYSSGATGPKCN